MRTTLITCDLCGNECKPPDFSVFSGAIPKLNEELKPGHVVFEFHLCPNETEKIYNFVQTLNGEHTNTSEIPDQPDKE